jgi:hypothetical protein
VEKVIGTGSRLDRRAGQLKRPGNFVDALGPYVAPLCLHIAQKTYKSRPRYPVTCDSARNGILDRVGA